MQYRQENRPQGRLSLSFKSYETAKKHLDYWNKVRAEDGFPPMFIEGIENGEWGIFSPYAPNEKRNPCRGRKNPCHRGRRNPEPYWSLDEYWTIESLHPKKNDRELIQSIAESDGCASPVWPAPEVAERALREWRVHQWGKSKSARADLHVVKITKNPSSLVEQKQALEAQIAKVKVALKKQQELFRLHRSPVVIASIESCLAKLQELGQARKAMEWK